MTTPIDLSKNFTDRIIRRHHGDQFANQFAEQCSSVIVCTYCKKPCNTGYAHDECFRANNLHTQKADASSTDIIESPAENPALPAEMPAENPALPAEMPAENPALPAETFPQKRCCNICWKFRPCDDSWTCDECRGTSTAVKPQRYDVCHRCGTSGQYGGRTCHRCMRADKKARGKGPGDSYHFCRDCCQMVPITEFRHLNCLAINDPSGEMSLDDTIEDLCHQWQIFYHLRTTAETKFGPKFLDEFIKAVSAKTSAKSTPIGNQS